MRNPKNNNGNRVKAETSHAMLADSVVQDLDLNSTTIGPSKESRERHPPTTYDTAKKKNIAEKNDTAEQAT